MARVKIENDNLVITMQGARKLLTLKGELSVPLHNVKEVMSGLAWKDAPKLYNSIRVGTHLPGVYFGGRFWHEGNKVFYDLKKQEDAVVITLKDESFDHIIFGVDNPEETIDLIEQVLRSQEKIEK